MVCRGEETKTSSRGQCVHTERHGLAEVSASDIGVLAAELDRRLVDEGGLQLRVGLR